MRAPPFIGGFAALLLALGVFAQDRAAIYNYRAADRDAKLVAAAKKEGTLTLYTSMQLVDSQPLTAAFEKKYGVKVSIWRAQGEKVAQRAITEARGGRHEVDVVETDGAQM